MTINNLASTTSLKDPGLPSSTLSGDLWGGLAAMLVALPSSVAFGTMVFSNLGANSGSYAGQGAMAGLLGAVALGLVAPWIGQTTGLITTPCAPAAAVLSTFMIELSSGRFGERLGPTEILSLMALTTFFSALLQVLYGTLGGGRLIKFIPYQVVSGYLSGVGLLIGLGQLPKLLGLPRGVTLFHGLISPALWKWEGLVVGIVTIFFTTQIAPRITRKIPPSILGLAAGITSYLFLALFFPHLRQLTDNPLIIGPLVAPANGSSDVSGLFPFAGQLGNFWHLFTEKLSSLSQIQAHQLRLIVIPSLTLSLLLSIDTLKTCVSLDAITRTRHRSDRELIGQGLGNLTSCILGGMPGAGAMGPTLVNVTSGGRTPRAGFAEGVFVLLALFLLGQWIAWIPVAALAGILLVIAYRMFDRSIFRLLRHPAGRLDFAVIAGVIIVALSVDLIAASGAGVALAILLFIRDQVRGSVIRQKNYLSQLSSKTQRQERDKATLVEHGHQGVICMLQGNLFFGTTDQLFTHLDADLKTCRFLLLDLRHVRSIDYTAVHLLEQVHFRLKEQGGQLLFSGMPSAGVAHQDLKHYLSQMGLLEDHIGIQVFETLDSALEWMEEKILTAHGVVLAEPMRNLDLQEFSLFRDLDPEMLTMLRSCMVEKAYLEGPGQRIVSCGDLGDELFLIRRGRVQILLPLKNGKRHHIATVAQGGFFGELSFLDHDLRSADVETKTPTEVYILSRSRFNESSRAHASLGAQVFARLASTTAKRLRATDAELRTLQER